MLVAGEASGGGARGEAAAAGAGAEAAADRGLRHPGVSAGQVLYCAVLCCAVLYCNNVLYCNVLLDSVPRVLAVIRESNVTLRWLVLHTLQLR